MESMIRDIALAPSGHAKIDWVKRFMPVMAAADKEYSVTKPFAGIKMVITLHLEAKTAYMATIFKHAGAEVAVTGSNPLSTQDDVAAALVEAVGRAGIQPGAQMLPPGRGGELRLRGLGADGVAKLIRRLVAAGVPVHEARREERSLEEVFMGMTGRGGAL